MSTSLTTAAQVANVYGGTWEAWGQGRVPVGVDPNDTDFNAPNKTGGSKTVTLTVTQIPSHKHIIPYNVSGGSDWYEGTLYMGGKLAKSTATSGRNVNTMTSVGGGGAHENMPPYRTLYLWKRTA